MLSSFSRKLIAATFLAALVAGTVGFSHEDASSHSPVLANTVVPGGPEAPGSGFVPF